MRIGREEREDLVAQLDSILRRSEDIKAQFQNEIEKVHPNYERSIENLLDYISLRSEDFSDLQNRLASIGLSSLGRAESHVRHNLLAVRDILTQTGGPDNMTEDLSYEESKQLLDFNSAQLLGSLPEERSTRIMVSLPTEASTNYELVKRLIEAGMECARINCAHDNENIWAKMISNIKKATKETGRPCKILMDIAGPKIRTGPLEQGPKVVQFKPPVDGFGTVTGPLTVQLLPSKNFKFDKTKPTIPVDSTFLDVLKEGSKITFKDRRGKKRSFKIVEKVSDGWNVHLFKNSYIETGTILKYHKSKSEQVKAVVGELPSKEVPIILKKGDILVLHKRKVNGSTAHYDSNGKVTSPAHISCTDPRVIDQVKVGESILLDDGKIEGKIVSVNNDEAHIEITYASVEGTKLKSDKGINLPESSLDITGLTAKDLEDIKFVAKNADIVNMSFVNSPDDIFALHRALESHDALNLGIMIKIETKRGFDNLPLLLLAAMQTYPIGVMIARGDLGVEVGWKRLAELQEEMLWICEAAHIPVVWATQVLENLAQNGVPSRAEITDAAMGQRAECVMLNKGPFIVEAVTMLRDILKTMDRHQYKKSPKLGMLNVSELLKE